MMGKSGDGEIAHGDPVRNEITLVNDQNDLFMSFLLFDILQNRFAHRSNWISRVEYMEDDIRRIDNFVKLAIDTS